MRSNWAKHEEVVTPHPLLPVFRLTIYYCSIFWLLIHRTGLEQLPIMKLQLLYVDSTLNLKLNVILPKFLHHLLLSVDWHSGKTVIGRCHTPSFPLWHSTLLQPPHNRRMWRGCFPFTGTCAPENGKGQVPTLSRVGYISQNEKKLFGLNGCLTYNETWEPSQTVVETFFCSFCIIFCTAKNSTRNWRQF